MLTELFEEESNQLLRQSDELYHILTHLRYEGKTHQLENLEKAGRCLERLAAIVTRHRHFQEEVLFPFLATHIPRHEAAIRFLEAEHRDIQKSENNLKKFVANDKDAEKRIFDDGISLVSLLKHHVIFEREKIQKSLLGELREDEKAAIQNRITKWQAKNRSAEKGGKS